MQAVVERVGNLLVISCDTILDDLKLCLQKEYSYRYQKYNPFRRRMEYTPRTLIKSIKDNVICLPQGFLLSVTNLLNKAGYRVFWKNIQGYTPHFENIENKTFRQSQRDVLEKIAKIFKLGSGGVLVAPPGYGKSFLISALVLLYPDITIDVISRRRDVIRGIYDNLQKQYGTVGLVTTGSRAKSRVTVYTADSLHHSDFSAKLIILDEVHELVTNKYYELLSRYDSALALGLTATYATRSDNLYRRIDALCGPIISTISYSEVEDLNLVVPIVVRWYNVPGGGMDLDFADPVTRKQLGIWRNVHRNELIACLAREQFAANKQTLILTETIEHALLLHNYLPDFEICYAGANVQRENLDELGFKPIGTKQREELRRKFLNQELMGVIATGVWSAGVSFDNLQCLIRADGSGSKTAAVQAPGRVCRIHEGKEYGLVIDFTDKFHSSFRRKALLRKKIYLQNGWRQVNAEEES